jgi:hypothetical protein
MPKFKIVIVVTDKPEVERFEMKESDGNGNYAALQRPWGQKDLAKIKMASKAMSLSAGGISDTEDVVRIANTLPRAGRHNGKKRVPPK